jgi:hypothetical protein
MLGLGLALTALLGACGGGSDDDNNGGNAKVRLLNASIGYSSLDMKADTKSINAAVGFGTTGNYTDVATDVTSAQIYTAGTTTLLSSPALSGIQKDKNYTVIAWGDTGAANHIVLAEAEAVPTTANKAKLLVMNLAAGAGTVDVYLTSATASLADEQPDMQVLGAGRTDSYREVDSGAQRLRVTATGSKTDLRLDASAVTFETGKVYILVLTSAPNSAMVNALVMPYQGAVTRYENGIAKARVISALPLTSTISAGINGVNLLNNIGSPAISAYDNVTITNGATLNWTVDGVAQPNAALTLARSNTYSVLLWGNPATPAVTTLIEDTALPVAGTARLRVINGVQGLDAVTLTVNLSPTLSGVAPGQLASTIVTNTVDELQISVRTGATTLFTQSRKLNSGGIYTILLSGTLGSVNAQLVQQ